jgi:hypothetical protein
MPQPIKQADPGTIRLLAPTELDRSGPCAKCHELHDRHYGPGPASPLCGPCRAAAGRPPLPQN